MKNKEQIAKIWDVLDSLNIDVLQNKKDISRIDEVLSVSNLWEPQKPKLKALDQSVFDGLDAKWRFAAVDKCGEVWLSTHKTQPSVSGTHLSPEPKADSKHIKGAYDTTDWQNSLIEREKVELTGSDLARAMLERGDKYVLCFVSDFSDDCAVNQSKMINLVTHKEGNSIFAKSARWKYAVPINQQTGEPLTQSEAGL